MRRVLLLNSSYEPLSFISDERAFRLVLKHRAEIVTNYYGKPSVWHDLEFKSPNMIFVVPATVRLTHFVVRKWRAPRFRKKVLFNRDNWQCQYCKKDLDWSDATIDHVLPKSRGGVTSWLNCVTSCKSCNKMKANQTPDEAKMLLLNKPALPTPLHFWDVMRSRHWHDDWDDFLMPANRVI